jgi:hypothetical protein
MDENGYPTEEELEYIRNFDVSEYDWEDLMKYIQGNCWYWGDEYFYKNGTEWIAITGGWSGCEDIIAALKQNVMFWMLYWKQSNRGGKYKFQNITDSIKKNSGALL